MFRKYFRKNSKWKFFPFWAQSMPISLMKVLCLSGSGKKYVFFSISWNISGKHCSCLNGGGVPDPPQNLTGWFPQKSLKFQGFSFLKIEKKLASFAPPPPQEVNRPVDFFFASQPGNSWISTPQNDFALPWSFDCPNSFVGEMQEKICPNNFIPLPHKKTVKNNVLCWKMAFFANTTKIFMPGGNSSKGEGVGMCFFCHFG